MVALHPTSCEACRVYSFDRGQRARHYAHRYKPRQVQLSYTHTQDRQGIAQLRKKLSREQLIEFLAELDVCSVVMEACARALHMARLLACYRGEAKLIFPQFVRSSSRGTGTSSLMLRPFPQEACRSPMRFVTPNKIESQQCVSALHSVRDSLVRAGRCKQPNS
jgi:hypothetical protein